MKKYMIINQPTNEILYFVYREGNKTDSTDPFDGYFWTDWKNVESLLSYEKANHPFTFETSDEARYFANRVGLTSFETKPVELEVRAKDLIEVSTFAWENEDYEPVIDTREVENTTEAINRLVNYCKALEDRVSKLESKYYKSSLIYI